MATTVGFLNVKLGLATGGLTTGVNQSISAFGRFGRAITSTKALLVGFAGAAGLGLVISRLRTLVSEQLKAVDAMAKLSDRTGFSTEDLAALSLASRIAGTDTEVLNRSLEIFSRRLGETALGIGEAKEGFDALGLSVNELLQLSPFEAFKRVADGIANLRTQAEKAAVANQLFGRSGSRLINLFDAGAAAIERAAADTEKFGTAISRVDAAKIEQANDAITRLGELFDGIIRQITIEIAPAIEEFTESLRLANEAGGGFGRTFSTVLLGLTTLWEALNGGVAFWLSLLAKAAQIVVRIGRLIPGLTEELEALDQIVTEMADASWQRFTDSGDRVIDLLNRMGDSAEKARGKVEDLFKPFDLNLPTLKRIDEFKPFPLALPQLEKIKDAAKEVTDLLLGDNAALTRGTAEASRFLRQQQGRRPLKTLEDIAKENLAVQKRIEARINRLGPPQQIPNVAVFGP